MAPDPWGGVYIAGSTDGVLEPGGVHRGGRDAVIVHYDAAGTVTWVRQFGTPSDEAVWALAPDGAGGVFAAGFTWGNLAAPNAGRHDAFVARFSASGAPLWTRQFGSTGYDIFTALCPDETGGVFATGQAHAAGSATGVILARYDGAGSIHWLNQFASNGADESQAIAPDGVGGVFIGGRTTGDLGGPFSGGEDGWVARYTSGGARVWIRQFGPGAVWGMASDANGGVYFGGQTGGSIGGPSAGDFDAFVGRLDSVGSYLWMRQYGSSASDSVTCLAPDGNGGVLVTGTTAGALFRPSFGSWDWYLRRLDGAGVVHESEQFGTAQTDYSHRIVLGSQGGFFCGGVTAGSFAAPNAGSFDLWVMSVGLSPCPNFSVEGFLSPMDAVVPEGQNPPAPVRAFLRGRTLPLKLRLLCGQTPLSNVNTSPPRIVGLTRAGNALNLAAVDPDPGEANDNGWAFRYSDGQWVYNLSTSSLDTGTYVIGIEAAGQRYVGAFVLR